MFASFRKKRLRRKLGPPIVVVSGLPRSGTSMMMNMLKSGGLAIVTDEQRGADDDNPKGYFELEQVKDLDKGGDAAWLADCRGKAVKVISYLLSRLPEEHYYQVIFMIRDLGEVLASQGKMIEHRGDGDTDAGDAEMIERFERHLRRVRIELRDRPNVDVLYLPYREVLNAPDEHAQSVARFLDSNPDVAAMATAVDKDLYRNRSA